MEYIGHFLKLYNRLWFPMNQTKDGEIENTGWKDFVYKIMKIIPT